MMDLKRKPDTHFLQIFSVSLKPHRRCYMIWPLILSQCHLSWLAIYALTTWEFFTLTEVLPFHIFAYAVPVPWNVTVTSLQGFCFCQVTPIPPFSLSSNTSSSKMISCCCPSLDWIWCPLFVLLCFSLNTFPCCYLLFTHLLPGARATLYLAFLST